MGTRSLIGFENDNGTVTATYCHYDGYLDHNGRLLLEQYNDKARALEIASVGYLSFLDPEGLEKSLAESVNKDKPSQYASEADFRRSHKAGWTEYAYLFRDGKWFYTKAGTRWNELTPGNTAAA